jgi:hypothetical protein
MPKNYVKLGFFGDSYADPGPSDSKHFVESYFDILCNKTKYMKNASGSVADWPEPGQEKYVSEGWSGASAYWGYHKFQQLALDKNTLMENAVVSFTDTKRIPFTNKEFAGASWINLFGGEYQDHRPSSEHQLSQTDTSAQKRYWRGIMDAVSLSGYNTYAGYTLEDAYATWNLFCEDNYQSFDTVRYINRQTLRSTVKLAKAKGINLVVVIPFENNLDEYLEEYPEVVDTHLVITGLDEVSHRETKTYPNDPEYNTTDQVLWHGNDVDVRCNHLCKTNNKILAGLVWEGIRYGRTGVVNIARCDGLDFTEIGDYATIIPKG